VRNGHDADALAVGNIVDADQIQRIGQRLDDFSQVDMNAAIGSGGRRGGATGMVVFRNR
jgi:hypothetical protein